jgi:hypothetical protein
VYHPGPVDHWRWTHTGLERLFRGSGEWSSLSVTPGAGTTACLGLLLGHYVALLAGRMHALRVGELAVGAINIAAGAIDRRSAQLREPVPGSLTTNFHVVARK